jgi:hypothetical protein
VPGQLLRLTQDAKNISLKWSTVNFHGNKPTESDQILIELICGHINPDVLQDGHRMCRYQINGGTHNVAEPDVTSEKRDRPQLGHRDVPLIN